MPEAPAPDTMSLAGLAAANGPWLADRLHRLSEHSGHALTRDVVESAVEGASRVLSQVMAAEGRPALHVNEADDPAVVLGREQALAHQQAGLTMPASLKVQRLLRRAYDDLVRESWVEKDSRARAHEDVERFFERALAGLVSAWTGQVFASPKADEAQAELLAQREDQLRRTLEAAQKLTQALRQSRERAEALAAGLSLAREQAARSIATLKAEFAIAHKEALAQAMTKAEQQAQAERQALSERVRELEEASAASGEALRKEAAEQLAQAREDAQRAAAEVERAGAEAQRARAEAQHGESQAETLRREARQAAETLEAARAETAALQTELRQLRTSHARLTDEAEAMRVRLAETGSRLATARAAESEENLTRLNKATRELAQAQERIAGLEEELRQSGQESQERLLALEERVAAGIRAEAEAREQLADLERASKEISQRADGASAAHASLSAERDDLAAERDDLLARLKDAEAQVIRQSEELEQAAGELAQARARAEASGADAQAQAQSIDGLSAERDDLLGRLKDAEAQVIRQSEELEQARQAQQAGEARRLDAERLAADAMARTGEAVLEVKAQAKAQLDRLAASREACSRLLAGHLDLTPDAVAALDATGAFIAWNDRFPALFGLQGADLAQGLEAVLPRLADCIQRPEAFVSRVRELFASPYLAEDGMTLATQRGQTLVFRCAPAKDASASANATGNAGTARLINFRDVSLEHDMEHLVREIEGITRLELGQSLTAFIHLPQELLDDPATTPAQAKKLAVIRDSGYRIVNTVNMAVDIFRMERGLYQPPAGRTLDLAAAARRAVRDVAPLAASRNVALSLLLEQEPLPQDATLAAPGDPILAHALVVNLLRDALAAAQRGSEVRAVLRREDTGPRLDISRSGLLDAGEAAAYFDKPLNQEPDHGLRRARYAAQLIARSLGGGLDVASSEGAGTTVSLHLEG